jgi:uncharacterized membrane protein YraQ (UPF0718 family)
MEAVTGKDFEKRANAYRFWMLAAATGCLLFIFWFSSRYPQLFKKATHIGQVLPTMAYSSELFPVTPALPLWRQILYTTINWLDGMKIGMSFGVLLGAVIHTYLHYFPLNFSDNRFLNALKGALLGAPAGVCANCSVPVACGLTRGQGRVETALGFLFSSPNFNPVVLTMSVFVLPWAIVFTKYLVLLALILLVVPLLIRYFERREPLLMPPLQSVAEACELPLDKPSSLTGVVKDLLLEFSKNLWALIKPTITIMLFSAFLASAMLIVLPWKKMLAHHDPLTKLLVSFLATIMPVPIALDVMFAKQLLNQGVEAGYVMLFALNLGAYSIIPSIYLWREISRKLATSLFIFFTLTGWLVSLLF